MHCLGCCGVWSVGSLAGFRGVWGAGDLQFSV